MPLPARWALSFTATRAKTFWPLGNTVSLSPTPTRVDLVGAADAAAAEGGRKSEKGWSEGERESLCRSPSSPYL